MRAYAEFMGNLERMRIMAMNSERVYRVVKTEDWSPEESIIRLTIYHHEATINLSEDGLYQSHSWEEMERLICD